MLSQTSYINGLIVGLITVSAFCFDDCFVIWISFAKQTAKVLQVSLPLILMPLSPESVGEVMFLGYLFAVSVLSLFMTDLSHERLEQS